MHTLKSKIILFFLITSLLIFSALGMWIHKIEKEERLGDLRGLLYHISSEVAYEYLDLNDPNADLRYLAGLNEIQSLSSKNAISNPEFQILTYPLTEKLPPNRIAVITKLPNGYYFRVSSDTRFIDKSLEHLTLELYLSFMGALSLSTLLFYLLLRRLLFPIEELVRACNTIDLEENSRHFPISSSSIEIQRLGESLQSLVDKVAFLRDKEREMFKEAAHQIKTPMAILKARLDQYSLDSTADKAKFLQQANSDIAKLLKYLKELLLVRQSHVSSHEAVESFDMEKLLKELTTYAAPLLQRKQQSVILDTQATFEVTTYRHTFIKLTLTILENCINHAPNGSSIILTLYPVESRMTFSNIIGRELVPSVFNSNLGLKIIRELSESLHLSLSVEQHDPLFHLSLTFPASQSNRTLM